MSFRPLEQVSDLFFAIGDAIHAAGLGVDVANYDDWDGKVRDAVVLVEIERTTPLAERQNDGRYSHDVAVTLHAVVAGWRKFAALEATNLATCLERLADRNRWGFNGRNCEPPRNLHSGPSIFQNGANGYSAWGATFEQILTPGEPPQELTLSTPPLVSWRVEGEGDLEDPENYRPL